MIEDINATILTLAMQEPQTHIGLQAFIHNYEQQTLIYK